MSFTRQFQYSIHTILYQRGVYPAEDFTVVKKYGLNMLVSSDDQVRAYIKKIMSQLDRWMKDGKISKLVIVITNKDTGEHLERWQFDVRPVSPPPPPLAQADATFHIAHAPRSSNTTCAHPKQVQIIATPKSSKSKSKHAASSKPTTAEDQENSAPPSATPAQQQQPQQQQPAPDKTEAEIQSEIAAIFRQITASVTFLPQLDAGECTFNVLVYADADSDVPVEWGDSDGKEIVGGERVQLRGFSTNYHGIATTVDYRQSDYA